MAHFFLGRFKAVLVDRDAYLLEVCRYVELNPVRARLVEEAEAWPWSSYRAHVGAAPTLDWLDTAGLHGDLLGRPAVSATDLCRAAPRDVTLVAEGKDQDLWGDALRQQIYLGDETFVVRMQTLAEAPRRQAAEVPRAQRKASVTLSALLAAGVPRPAALRRAHVDGGVTMTALAAEVGLSVSRVSRLIAKTGSV